MIIIGKLVIAVGGFCFEEGKSRFCQIMLAVNSHDFLIYAKLPFSGLLVAYKIEVTAVLQAAVYFFDRQEGDLYLRIFQCFRVNFVVGIPGEIFGVQDEDTTVL